MKGATGAAENYLSRYDEFEAKLGRNGSSWVLPLRKKALTRFGELRFPTPKEEEWRHTNVAPIERRRFLPAGSVADSPPPDRAEWERFTLRADSAAELVFWNGLWMPGLSTVPGPVKGIRWGSLADALVEERARIEPHLGHHASFQEHPFVALNTAFFRDGSFLHIGEGVKLDKPVHLLFLSGGSGAEASSHPRNLILAERESEATIIETYVSVGETPHLSNAVTEIVVRENASIDHYKVQDESKETYHVAALQAHQEQNSRLASYTFTFGGKIARSDIGSVLAGEGIETVLDGLYMGREDQLIDHHTFLDHARPHCTSHELYKGILGGRSRGVFRGKILVRQDAQKTDAKQGNHALLLSEEAVVNTKPQLEIYADDVKCTHGATIGQIDEESLFYLRSRGISRGAARALLVSAFAGEVVDRIRPDALRGRVEGILAARLPEGKRIKESL